MNAPSGLLSGPRVKTVCTPNYDRTGATIRIEAQGEGGVPVLFGVLPSEVRGVCAYGDALIISVKGVSSPEVFTCEDVEDATTFTLQILKAVDAAHLDARSR